MSQRVSVLFLILFLVFGVLIPSAGAQEDSLALPPSAQKDMEFLRRQERLDEIFKALQSKNEVERIHASLRLRKEVTPDDLKRLVDSLKTGNKLPTQIAIIEAIGALGDKRAGDALRFEIQHGRVPSQRAATTALGKLHTDWAVPILLQVLKRAQDIETRKRASCALLELGTKRAIGGLQAGIRSAKSNPGLSRTVAYALEKLSGGIPDGMTTTKIPPGKRIKAIYKGFLFYVYHPTRRDSIITITSKLKPRTLACIHGSNLDAAGLYDQCFEVAQKNRLALVVPLFDPCHFPTFGDFNPGGLRPDHLLLEVLQHVAEDTGVSVKEIYLFGEGEGGDFANRFVMNYPKRIGRALYAANRYPRLNATRPFPMGIGPSPLFPDLSINLYDFVKTDAVIITSRGSFAGKIAKSFGEALLLYSKAEAITPRVEIRDVSSVASAWEEAEEYLFEADTGKWLAADRSRKRKKRR